MKKLTYFILLILLATPVFALAQGTTTGSGGNWCAFGKIVYPCPFGANTQGPVGQASFGKIAANVINIALLLAATVAVIFLILGAFRYITAAGNEEQMESAKKTMTGAIVGLVIIFLSFAIIAIVSRILISGNVDI